jgi:hypothetical protein
LQLPPFFAMPVFVMPARVWNINCRPSSARIYKGDYDLLNESVNRVSGRLIIDPLPDT